MTAPIMAGAEPESIDGGPNGALVLHGFTGQPATRCAGSREALADAGFTVELPLLPGHGTSVEDMITDDVVRLVGGGRGGAREAAERACDGKVVVVGLSMGGSLTAWLGTRHPELAGLALSTRRSPMPAEMREAARGDARQR